MGNFTFHIANHIKKITNWAECDVFCSSLKITKKYKKEMWQFIQELKNSSYPFSVRFALVMMLSYYMQEEYLEQIFVTIVSTHHEHYYVKMANAWLISYCFVHFFAQTSQFMLENSDKIDSWTYQKGLQKSLESNRITTEEKEKIKKMRKLNSFL